MQCKVSTLIIISDEMNKRIYDPLYGLIELSDLEYKILLTPEIQRLRYVRLCNVNSLLITGASETSRFEHIVGVLKLTKEWAKTHKRIPKDVAQNLCIAAIMHDMLTGPFGHSVQYIFEDNDFEKKFIHDNLAIGTKENYYQNLFALTSFEGKQFKTEDILGNEQFATVKNFIRGIGDYGKLISGTIDFDNIDNVIRLGYHVGIATKEDAKLAINLVKDIDLKENQLICSAKNIPAIIRWQEIRKKLYELLLYDWADFSAKAMLTFAVETAIENGLIGLESWQLTDLELLDFLTNKSVGEHQDISRLIKKLKIGDLFHPIILLSIKNVHKYKELSKIQKKRSLEDNIKKVIKKDFGVSVNCIFLPILDNKKTERAIEIIIRENNKIETIGNNSAQILIGIFLSSKLTNMQEKAIKKNIFHILNNEDISNIKELTDPFEKDLTHNDLQMGLF